MNKESYLIGYTTEDNKFKILFETVNYRMATAKAKVLAQKMNKTISIKRRKKVEI